jgi:hypothetical protein
MLPPRPCRRPSAADAAPALPAASFDPDISDDDTGGDPADDASPEHDRSANENPALKNSAPEDPAPENSEGDNPESVMLLLRAPLLLLLPEVVLPEVVSPEVMLPDVMSPGSR